MSRRIYSPKAGKYRGIRLVTWLHPVAGRVYAMRVGRSFAIASAVGLPDEWATAYLEHFRAVGRLEAAERLLADRRGANRSTGRLIDLATVTPMGRA